MSKSTSINSFMGLESFPTIEAFMKQLLEHERATGTRFNIRNCKKAESYKKNNLKKLSNLELPVGYEYYWIQLNCTHNAREWKKKHKTTFVNTNCGATISLVFRHEPMHYVVTQLNLVHNHETLANCRQIAKDPVTVPLTQLTEVTQEMVQTNLESSCTLIKNSGNSATFSEGHCLRTVDTTTTTFEPIITKQVRPQRIEVAPTSKESKIVRNKNVFADWDTTLLRLSETEYENAMLEWIALMSKCNDKGPKNASSHGPTPNMSRSPITGLTDQQQIMISAEPNEQDLFRLAGMSLTDPEMEGIKKPGTPASKLAKSNKSMLLKAFEAAGPSHPKTPEIKTSRGSTRVFKSPKKSIMTKAQDRLGSGVTAIEAVEAYFMSHGDKSSAGKTSNRTLSNLGEPGLIDPLTFAQGWKASRVEHADAVKKAQTGVREKLFPKWMFYLHEGFNILLYGVGSKHNVLEDFRKRHLAQYNCIVVPGYEMSTTIKRILSSICHDWLQVTEQCKTSTEQLQQIVEMMSQESAASCPLYLLVHNIDGYGLRNAKSQAILARLAAVPHIHLIASFDHANLPILWSHTELARFAWIWEDCTTLAPYELETDFSQSTLLQNILGHTGTLNSAGGAGGVGAGALASLRQVAASLTQNARDIFRMIAEHQLNAPMHETRGDSVGMPLEDLYWRCRDAFLTNNEATLRAQLTEFRDHKLMKIRKGGDGTELLLIPMDKASLEKFVANFDSFC